MSQQLLEIIKLNGITITSACNVIACTVLNSTEQASIYVYIYTHSMIMIILFTRCTNPTYNYVHIGSCRYAEKTKNKGGGEG